MDSFFATVTWLGSLYVLLPSALLLVMALVKAGRHGDAALLGISLPAATVVTHVVKLIVRRPRPVVTDPLVALPGDWSFPSAHTAQAASFFLALAVIATRRLPPSSAVPAVTACLLVVAGVGYSRIHLQVHHPSDVVGGLIVAILIVALVRKCIPPHLPNGPE